MATVEIDVGPLPPEARSVVIDYRNDGDPASAAVKLGETQEQVSRWTVPDEGKPVLVRARIRDRNGRIWPGREEAFTPGTEVTDRADPADLTAPAPTVTQDGPALAIVQEVPEGEDPREYVVEAVQTPTADTSPKNGLHLGYHDPGDAIAAHAWPDDQKIWTRLVRKEDEARTDWSAATVETARPIVNPTDGFTTDFAGGTIAKLGGATVGQSPLEVSGGDLRHKALYIGDADGYIGDADYFIGDAGLYWSPATFTTPNITLPAAEHLQFQFQPVLTSITRPSLYIGDAMFPIGGPPRVDVDGTIRDNRLRRLNLTGGADEIPIDIDVKVATSSSASPTFGDSDFKPLVPGKVYRNVLVYACRVVIRTWHGVRVTFDALKFWHWVWCRTRPWHTHADAGELIDEKTAVADAASMTATFTAEDWDEIRIEIDWKNADASASQLRVRFNVDTGSNYYVDGAAAATGFLIGPGTLTSGWYERASLVLTNPKSGLERRVLLGATQRSGAADSAAGSAPKSGMWDNTADQITSIVFGATVGSTPIAQGSRIRVFGKRHHAA